MRFTNIKKLSIITVTLNAVESLQATLTSVKNQIRRNEIEFIIVDGLSNDGSLDLLNKYSTEIDVLVSSKDRGVYDAMNKAAKIASSEIIYFLNAGDVFTDNQSLSRILDEIYDCDVLYSDVLVDSGNKLTYEFKTSYEARILNHQGFVYRKDLHDKFGPYAVINGFTAADYFFFLQLNGLKVKKLNTPIAIFKTGGLSSTINAVRQKYCLDFLAGKRTTFNLVSMLVLYPCYRAIARLLKWR